MKLLFCKVYDLLILEKILEKVLKTIASNIAFEHFEFFCQKLQLNSIVIKTIETDRLVIRKIYFFPLGTGSANFTHLVFMFYVL